MKKNTSVSVLVVFIVAALFFGLLLVNKGDGPVMGAILANDGIDDADAYSAAAENHHGVYLVLSTVYNGYQEDYTANIPAGEDLYAVIHFVECPRGSKFIGKWIVNGELVEETIGTLMTGPTGVISYMLDGNRVVQGDYVFALYDDEKQIFETTFSVE